MYIHIYPNQIFIFILLLYGYWCFRKMKMKLCRGKNERNVWLKDKVWILEEKSINFSVILLHYIFSLWNVKFAFICSSIINTKLIQFWLIFTYSLFWTLFTSEFQSNYIPLNNGEPAMSWWHRCKVFEKHH